MNEEIKPISEARLTKIFGDIGLTRDQVAAIGASHSIIKTIKHPKSLRPKPICRICGQRIGVRTCKPFRQRVLALTKVSISDIRTAG
jgi:hypothetical protein